ncbi:hypothetical protein C4M96_02570, partial [Mycoplasmopsis pullorum]
FLCFIYLRYMSKKTEPKNRLNLETQEAESIVSKIKYQVFKPKTVYSIESLFFKIKILCP